MPEPAEILEQRKEYWRPAIDDETRAESRRAGARLVCTSCDATLAPGSQFCHLCGTPREGAQERRGRDRRGMPAWLNVSRLQSALGLSPAPLTAFAIGIACVLAALITGFVYSASTLTDWQAVQVWRGEWLLAAITAILVGLLLKK